jgi:hypothetical protein
MICPVCKHPGAKRSRRQFAADHILAVFGVYPWRCTECRARFHARLMRLSDALRVHCPICGNADLRRIAPEHVRTRLSAIGRVCRLRAFRCDPCRHKFFSILPRRYEDTVELSPAD